MDHIYYVVKTNQALVVLYKDEEIYASLIGPGNLDVCCENDKKFFWINTGVQTVAFPEFNATDSNNDHLKVALVVTYRVTDLKNYIFNLKGGPTTMTAGAASGAAAGLMGICEQLMAPCEMVFMLVKKLIMMVFQLVFRVIMLVFDLPKVLICASRVVCSCCFRKVP